MKEKCIIIIILILISGFLITYPIEEEPEMELKRFKDLGIVSSKKPFNTHLWWEHPTYGLVLVDADDQTKLFISTDKADNWAEIDLSDNANSYKIQSGYLDGNDLWLVMCDNDGTADDFEVCFIEFDDSNDCNPVGVSATGDVNTIYAYDIWKEGASFYVVSIEVWGGNSGVLVSIVDSAPFGPGGHYSPGGFTFDDISYSVTSDADTLTYLFVERSDGDVSLLKTWGAAIILSDVIVDVEVPDNRNQCGLAYDNDNIISFILKLTADGKTYLYSYNITGDATTQAAEYNIALMMDRNTASGVLEKAFGIVNEIVYEIKPKRGGLIQLQDCSNISDNNLIAITDNFLMNDDGDMFEFQDVTNEISSIIYKDGIMGVQKKGTFITHPDFHINWSKGDSIKIYDQYDQLEFWGLITDKNRNNRGLYVFKIDSFTNEIYRNNYSTTYSANDTDTKQKDIIDNACDFCYRDSSIVGTTTTYNYVYNRAITYLFWLARRLERQVPYIEPDGKIWTKAHDGLSKNPLIYPGTYNQKDEAVGTTGTSIDFVDTLTPGGVGDSECIIISSQGSHRNVIKLTSDGGARLFAIQEIDNPQTSGTIELWVETTTGDGGRIYFMSEVAVQIMMFIDMDIGFTRIIHGDGVGGNTIVSTASTGLSHVRLTFDCSTDTFSAWVDGVEVITDENFYLDRTATTIDEIYIANENANTEILVDAVGFSWDPAYTIGDNEVAWDLNNHWQDVRLVDIPGIEEGIQGFFDGNTGITRNTIRYRDNAQTIRPVAATRDPIEQLKGILPLNEFRDPKIEASTEADQLGDNRYAIWSADTIFLGLRVAGQGYLQPGKTIHIENTGQITIAESNLLLLSFTRNPKNDVYTQMILSDNIIFPSEFNNLANTSRTQIHTATVQSFENQADIIAHLTPEGGLALRLTNKTGVASVKGTIVEAHAATDNAFRVCDANSLEMFGIVYEDGIADGAECLVVVGGRVQVLLKDATASTRNFWVRVSDVAGRADATTASPPATPTHFYEIGHCIESKGADTDVLAFIILHFN